MTYPLTPFIDALEARGSTDMFEDAGGVTADVWQRWAAEGLTAVEAVAAAEALGVDPPTIWPDWRPDLPTEPAQARRHIAGLRQQLEAS